MERGRPSVTAFRVAMRRAAHQVLDEPRVLDDSVALRIIGTAQAAALRADRKSHDSRFDRHLRAFLVARSRCAEDALAEAIARGVTQYVVLGDRLRDCGFRTDPPTSSSWLGVTMYLEREAVLSTLHWIATGASRIAPTGSRWERSRG